MREGRSPHQIGRKGLSNHRWIVGGKLCLLLNQWGLVVACAYSGRRLPLMPVETCHRFQSKVATDAD